MLECRGKLLLPGGVDPAVHLLRAFGALTSTDDFYAGTKAALAGCTTHIGTSLPWVPLVLTHCTLLVLLIFRFILLFILYFGLYYIIFLLFILYFGLYYFFIIFRFILFILYFGLFRLVPWHRLGYFQSGPGVPISTIRFRVHLIMYLCT